MTITGWGVLMSYFNDFFGVRNSLLIGFVLTFLARTVIALTTDLTVLYVMIFGLLPLGTAMGIPMLTVGIKRVTTRSNRGFVFGLYYSVMNVAALVSGPVVDILNIGLDNGMVIGGRRFSGNRLVIFTAAMVSVIAFGITFLWMRDVKVEDVEEEEGEDNGVELGFVRESQQQSAEKEEEKEALVPKNEFSAELYQGTEQELEEVEMEGRQRSSTSSKRAVEYKPQQKVASLFVPFLSMRFFIV